jgi:hypothetical protein
MRRIEIGQRLKYYLKFLGYYILGVMVVCGVSILIMIYNEGLGVLFGFLLIVLLFCKLHLDIGTSLIDSRFNNKVVMMLPIICISTALLFLKIYVNEHNPSGEHPLISEKERIVNYLLYSLWTTILLWECYYILWFKFKQTKTM